MRINGIEAAMKHVLGKGFLLPRCTLGATTMDPLSHYNNRKWIPFRILQLQTEAISNSLLPKELAN